MKMLHVWPRSECEIQNAGYAILPSRFFKIPFHFAQAWKAFARSWEHLPRDESISGAYCYRFRRYSRILCYPRIDKIETLPHTRFFQSPSTNPLYGGVERKFAPVLSQEIKNPVLRELIGIDFCHFEIPPSDCSLRWLIGVHQIRIVGRRGHPGIPTPEGVHRDGSRFIGMHLVSRRNVRGGHTRIYGEGQDEPTIICLTNPSDSLVIDDSRIRHSVTPIRPLKGNGPAVRDMLILTYDAVVNEAQGVGYPGRAANSASASKWKN